MEPTPTFSAFAGSRLVAAGPLATVLAEVRGWLDRKERAMLLVFDDQTGRAVDFDLRGTVAQVLARALPPPDATPRPGRPRLGVVGREVSLLPRHWEWLEEQPNGISAALRRLVDEARKREPGRQRALAIRAATSRVMTALAGDLPGFEEATRALFAGDGRGVERQVAAWPVDVRAWVLRRVREAARLERTDAGGAPEIC
jgi:hypothetical protein